MRSLGLVSVLVFLSATALAESEAETFARVGGILDGSAAACRMEMSSAYQKHTAEHQAKIALDRTDFDRAIEMYKEASARAFLQQALHPVVSCEQVGRWVDAAEAKWGK
jgi:hypothetical protein